MYHFRKAACCWLLLAVSAFVNAQLSYPKTLLWRISGKGLSHPSYLYGTMHLTDKRLFNFGDSVYQAIEKSEGLAIEVNPDEMAAYIVNQMMDEAEGKTLRDILTKKDYQKYSAALARKFKKRPEDITTKDIVREKNKWMNEYLEKGEMPTFMDAYLYNMARRQGKWVGGVEDMADQSGLLDELVDKSDIEDLLAGDSSMRHEQGDRMMNEMIEMYNRQDILAMENMSGDDTPEHKDQLLIKRNIKMARRIDSLMAFRSMFIAIGAAHLAGDSGVIHLLQQRGFTVEPVFSSKKISSTNYTFKEVRIPWMQAEDAQGYYTVSMPGNPATVKLFGLIDAKFLFDIFNLSSYCTMTIVNPGRGDNKDSVLSGLAQRMFRTTKTPTGKKVICNGVEGREYKNTIEGQPVRLQAFIQNNLVYIIFLTAIKKETLASADADRFFGSFTINKVQPVAATAYPFTDSIMGIRFLSPAKLSYNKKISADNHEGWRVHCFNGSDMASGTYVILFSKEIRPGHYITSDTIVQKEFMERMEGQYDQLVQQPIEIQHVKGIKVQGRNKENPDIYLNAVSLIHNNRNIILMCVSDSGHLGWETQQKMFASLQFIQQKATPWNTYDGPDATWYASAPGSFRSFAGKQYRLAFDTTTARSYFVYIDTLGKYTWYTHDSIFWKKRIPDYLFSDSLEKETDVQNGELTGKEILSSNGQNYHRMRLLPCNHFVYKITVVGEKDFVCGNEATRFLSSFRVKAPETNPHFITTAKTELLLKDLASEDSVVRNEAYDAIEKMPFGKKDLPLLHEALFKTYRSSYKQDTSDGINMALAEKLGLLKDTSTITLIKDTYPQLQTLKHSALVALATMHTRESYATLGELAEKNAPPAEGLPYALSNALEDSLALTATIFPQLQQWAKDSVQAPYIADLALTMLDSGFIKKEQLTANDYIQAARGLLPTLLKTDDGVWQTTSLATLVTRLNLPAGNAIARKYLGVKDKWLREQVAVEMVKIKQPVPASVFNTLAADKTIRQALYNDLKDGKKTALFPKQYLTQAYFAEAAMYEYASDDEDLEKMLFLAKKTTMVNGKPYTFYLYRVVYDTEEAPAGYLGIAGGYTGTSLEPAKYFTGVYWKEPFDAKHIDSLFRKYIKSMQEEE